MAVRSTHPTLHRLMPDSTDAREWVRYATSDLRLAETVPSSGVLLERLCFHAQQAAEKAAKAVLVAFGVVPPRVHATDYLLALVREHIEFPDAVRQSGILTDFAVVSRYPADFGALDEAEWTEAVALAAVAWAEGAVERRA